MENCKAVIRLAGVFVCAAWIAAGQTTQGLIAGKLVNSQTGAPIAKAGISYSNAATGSSGIATSDASGNFFLPMLSPGFYRIRATVAGYQTREVQELELPVAARLELNFRLRPLNDVWEAGQYNSVFLPGSKTIVTFYGPDVDSTKTGSFEAQKGRREALESTISEVINRSELSELPLAGRDRFHGLGYFYLKNDALNANGFQENLAGTRRNPAKEIQPGYFLGGPILKNRLFFSSALEHLRSRSFQDPFTFLLP